MTYSWSFGFVPKPALRHANLSGWGPPCPSIRSAPKGLGATALTWPQIRVTRPGELTSGPGLDAESAPCGHEPKLISRGLGGRGDLALRAARRGLALRLKSPTQIPQCLNPDNLVPSKRFPSR